MIGIIRADASFCMYLSRPASRLRQLLPNLALFALGTVASMGLAEVIVRLAAPQQLIQLRPDLFRPVDSLGWMHQPNIHTQVNTGNGPVWMHTDSSGFRVAKAGRAGGRPRVLVLGDSFLAAMQVEYEQSLPGLMEQCLASSSGQTAEVWNTAVSGWGPNQYYLQAARVLNAATFDVMVVGVFLGNDVVDYRRPYAPREPWPRRRFRVPRDFTPREFIDAILAPINDGLETRSHLFVFLKNRFQGILMRLGLTAIEVPTELRRDQASSPRWSITADILAAMDSLATVHGISALFVLIPSIEQVDAQVLKTRVHAFGIEPGSLDVDQPSRLLSAELGKRKLRYVSLLEPLRTAQARGLSLYGRVDTHPSADGHRVMWNAVAPELSDVLGLPTGDYARVPHQACRVE